MNNQLHIECGPGWASLYEPLIERCKAARLEVERVYQKYGSLRIDVRQWNEEIETEILAAEDSSLTICEECGAPGVLRGSHWLRTRCDLHGRGEPPAEEK